MSHVPLPVEFHGEAEAELDAAVVWYASQRPDLGTEFAKAVQHGLGMIEQYPHGWHRLGRRVRRYRLRRFPYGIVYAPLEDKIVVLAVMHLHRKPDYWRDRLCGA